MIASLEKTWRLCKGMKPFTDSELIKKFKLDAIESVVENHSNRNELIKKKEGIPPSGPDGGGRSPTNYWASKLKEARAPIALQPDLGSKVRNIIFET